MAGEYLRPDMSLVDHLAGVIEETTLQWMTVANLFGEVVAGNLPRCVAEAILLDGYRRQVTPSGALGSERRGK